VLAALALALGLGLTLAGPAGAAESPSPSEASTPTRSAGTASPTATVAPTVDPGSGAAIPVWAYFYIWYDPSTWDRAKKDLPLAGTYSSDERRRPDPGLLLHLVQPVDLAPSQDRLPVDRHLHQ
jgi:hypothetical protein